MKKFYIKHFLLSLIVLFLASSYQFSAFSQNYEEISVEGVMGYPIYGYQVPERPVFYRINGMLASTEMHVMPPLTKEERDFIEAQYSPSAIGVYREFQVPIRFDLDKTLIPAVNDEFQAFGGRLTRVDENTMVWTIQFRSEGADELRVYFSEGYFPFGVKVNLFSKNDYAFNQYQMRGMLDEYGFYTTTTFAEWVTIQVVIPIEVIDEPLYFTISGIVHSESKYIENFLLNHCIEDAMCAQANSFTHINNLRLSAAQLTFVVGGGSFICSGGLLNDQRAKDLQPYLLTANHCFSTQTSAASLEARFDFRTTSCNGANNPAVILINGSNLIATNSQSDFTLVLLRGNPALPRWYLGWTTAAPSNLSTLHSVHHPGGQRQRYTRLTLYTSPSHTCASRPTTHYHYSRNVVGESFGGSSGAPVVNASNQVIGQNWGRCFETGDDNCAYSTYHVVWGKWSSSYNNNNLQFWLGASPGAQVTMSTNPASSLNFGTRDVNTNTTLNVTVTNTGTVPNFLNLEAGNITITGTNASQFSIVGGNFLYLPPGASGTFQIRFTPTSSGYKTATLNIPHNADNIASPRVITLTGTGNPCSESFSLNNGGVANTRTFSRSGTGAWHTSSNTPCGFQSSGTERIYSFTAPYTGTYRIHITSTNGALASYMWKSGSCSSTGWNCIVRTSATGVYGSMSFTAGSTYLILIDAESTSTTTHTFYIGTPGRWEGSSGADWFTTNNWYDGVIPTSETNVIIAAGKPNNPSIGGGQTAYCNNLIVSSGASLTMNSTSYLWVHGIFDPALGQFTMNGATSYLYLTGTTSTNWWNDLGNDIYTNVRIEKTNSAASVNMLHNTVCSHTFHIRGGRFQMSSNRTLTVNSTASDAFRVQNDGTLVLSAGQTIDVAGSILFQNGSNADVSGGSINCGGNFTVNANTPYDISIAGTTLTMNGSGTQSINDQDGGTLQLGNLTIDKPSGTVSVTNSPLNINGNLLISDGTLNSNSHNINIRGNWTNNVGSGAFLAGTGTVFFNGISNHQQVSGANNFHNIQNSKTGAGELRLGGTTSIANNFIANNTNVVNGTSMNVDGLLNLSTGSLSLTNVNPTVSVNNFTMGGILGVAGGSFTCTDITHSGILGTITLSNGNITLNQADAQYTDLRGTLNISGGTMEVNGYFGTSMWGWGGTPTHLNMTGGVLDFRNPGLQIETGLPVTTSISGGLIRTSGFFVVTNSNFTPTGGTAELYGPSDVAARSDNGSHFYNLVINKNNILLAGGEEEKQSDGNADTWLKSGGEITDEEIRKHFEPEIPTGRSSNTVFVHHPVKVVNNTTINEGSMVVNNNASFNGSIESGGNVTINSGGKIELNDAASLTMGASRSITVNNGGALELNGNITYQPRISRISTGNYALNVESGATIGAVYALLEHMNTLGVNLKPGSVVDHTKAFHNTTFRNGQSGGRLLTINNSQSFSVNYANFPNNTWGGTYNVFKTENAGVVVFGGHGGLFSGEANEWDPFNRIHWGGEISPFVNLQGVNLVGGQDMCFEATNTLTVGGGGSVFHVQNGANANLVAGQKIVMLDGTRVFSGGYMLARITTTSDYCSLPPALLAFPAEEESEGLPIETPQVMVDDFISRAYPNPTTGMITLELSQVGYNTTLEIYGSLGERILFKRIDGMLITEIDLSGQPAGIYFMRIVNESTNRVIKVVKQ